MKILYITDFLYGDISGANTVAKAHLSTLIDIAGEENVDIVALVGSKNINEKGIIINGYSSKMLLFINSLCGYTTYTNYFIEKEILKIINNNCYDIIFIDNSIYGKLTKKIKNKYPEKLVISFYHDVKQHLCKEWKKNCHWLKKVVYSAMMKNERINQRYSDINLTLNNRESELYNVYYNSYPEGNLSIYMDIDTDEKVLEKNIQSIGNKINILFVGGYYYPNVNGITWFIENIKSRISIPINLNIVGNGMEKLEEESFPEWVNILGSVDSLSPYYEEADLVIGPIFEGGGMKVKTAEALGYGKIILASKESFIGYIENIPNEYIGKYVFECQQIEEYIDALNYIYENRDNMKKYNSEIRLIFNENYSKEAANRKLLELIKKYIQ